MDSQTNQDVTAYDVQTPLAELLSKVEAGEEIVITREGNPIARLVPVDSEQRRRERKEAVERILQRRERLTLGGLKIRDLIDEGRR